MSKYTYGIDQFNWHPQLNTFLGDMNAIWAIDNKYQFAFPSARSQFVILNSKTGGFRRFRFKSENTEIHYCTDICTNVGNLVSLACLNFESEDGILCKVYY